MIIIKNMKFGLETDFEQLKTVVADELKINENDIINATLFKKAVDARRKNNIHFVCSVVIETQDDWKMLSKLTAYDASLYQENEYVFPEYVATKNRPLIVGFGPAGMFAAYMLAEAGAKPIVIERGKDVDSRTADVETFFKTGKLDPESNIQFGEGGAGTFSDGKLNTGTKDNRIKEVLKIFVKHGAPKSILYDSKPHIGTDVLKDIVKSIREHIISLGGEILFGHKLLEVEILNNQVVGAVVSNNGNTVKFECEKLVLATGHSARDVFSMLKQKNVPMEPKAFAVGARIEHKRSFIDRAMYGDMAGNKILGAADYRLAVHLKDGRGIFTFCMCPGGVVVNSSSEVDGLVTNGMSYSKRDGENSNSAVLVSVAVDDYYKGDVLDGVEFQREIEKKAYELGGGKPLVQTLKSFLGTEYKMGMVKPTIEPQSVREDITKVMPEFVVDGLKQGLRLMNNKLNGFIDGNAFISFPETRSSSPVRVLRNEDCQSETKGLYPCGEGSGYAGGITSAAVDGMKIAEKVAQK